MYDIRTSPIEKDVRKITNLTLSLSVKFGYLLKFPFGGEGWIVRPRLVREIGIPLRK
jgi:hypothetical protein